MKKEETLQSLLEESKRIASNAFISQEEKRLLPAIITVLLIFGALLIGMAYNKEAIPTNSGGYFWNGFSENLGTELLGAVLVFVLMSIAVGAIQISKLLEIRTIEIIAVLLLLGVICFLYAYTTFDSSNSFENYFSGVSLNLCTQIIGSLVVYLLLENVVTTFKERENNIRTLVEKIDLAIEATKQL